MAFGPGAVGDGSRCCSSGSPRRSSSGWATLFMLKTEADQHWSDPPVVAVIIAYDQAAHPDEPND